MQKTPSVPRYKRSIAFINANHAFLLKEAVRLNRAVNYIVNDLVSRARKAGKVPTK